MIRLIAVDLDDTLLNSHKQLSPATVEGLQTALASGIKVVPCTGRPLPGVRTTLDALGLHGDDQYVIVQGGGVVQSTSGKSSATLSVQSAILANVLSALPVKATTGTGKLLTKAALSITLCVSPDFETTINNPKSSK